MNCVRRECLPSASAIVTMRSASPGITSSNFARLAGDGSGPCHDWEATAIVFTCCGFGFCGAGGLAGTCGLRPPFLLTRDLPHGLIERIPCPLEILVHALLNRIPGHESVERVGRR